MGLFSDLAGLLLVVVISSCFVDGSPFTSTEPNLEFSVTPNDMDKNIGHQKKFSSKSSRKKPTVGPSAPLDINENVSHTLEEVSQILGSVSGAAGGLVMGLTGISLSDCAGSVKGKDLSTLSCSEFLTTLSECESLSNLKPLLQQAAKNKRKNPKSKKPCFK